MGTLLDLLFPPRCVFCRKVRELDRYGCCPDCAPKLRRAGPFMPARADACAGAAVPFWYAEPVRSAIHHMKFYTRKGFSRSLALYMADSVRERIHCEAGLVTWIPVSRKRKRERGYDQAELLAKALARELGLPCERTLRKVRNTRPQSSLSKAEKLRSPKGVYAPADPFPAGGKTVILVDDVITTGSTLREASATLRKAGAGPIYAAAIARSH